MSLGGGLDLVVPLFIPSVLMVRWRQNILQPIGLRTPEVSLPQRPQRSISCQPCTPVTPAKARVVGERAVPALRPGERSEVKQLQFVLQSELPADIYYLAACADVAGALLELDESNNCSSHKSPAHSSMAVPLRRSETPSQ